MAKKRTEGGATSARAVEEKIEGFAEDLGRLLGTAQAKAGMFSTVPISLSMRSKAMVFAISSPAALPTSSRRLGTPPTTTSSAYPARHPTWSLPSGVAVAGGVVQVLVRRRAATRLRRQP